ncbi:unnamed protein product [marine sediment metagenome]|uniref:Uncharacterized protein n=1 Tax=marine sediment metagenome TaxID=412755 RepID=X1V889_9ZZZZ
MEMTIDKAIEILEALSKGIYEGDRADAQAAEKLGTEALKRIRHDREAMQAKHVLLLPGETEE